MTGSNETDPVQLAYKRPLPYRDLPYRRLYQAAGLFGLVASSLLGALYLLIGTLLAVAVGISAEPPVPGIIVGSLLGVGLATILFVGSLHSRQYPPRGRRLILLFAKADLAVVGLMLAISVTSFLLLPLAAKRAFTLRVSDWLSLAVTAVRVGFDLAVYLLYSNARADCYFHQVAEMSHQVMHVAPIAQNTGGEAGSMPSRPSVRRGGRFLVRGTDICTGEHTEFTSNAASEPLARRAAIAMGFDPESIEITAIG